MLYSLGGVDYFLSAGGLMPTTWAIAPFEARDSQAFDDVWGFALTNQVISIGWRELGDLSGLDRPDLLSKVITTYPQLPLATHTLFTNMLWAFWHDIKIGDIVVARRGRKALVGIGRVTGPASYAPGRNPACTHPNFLPVEWDPSTGPVNFESLVFAMHTVWQLPADRWDIVASATKLSPQVAPTVAATGEAAEFALEKYLEDFLVTNFKSIFKGTLRIYGDQEEAEGQQFSTDVGFIDILATDTATGDFVVVELKKGRPSDQVVGQTLRYMGWVRSNLCSPTQQVRGLIICRESDPRLAYALQMVPNIALQHYRVDFTLSDPG